MGDEQQAGERPERGDVLGCSQTPAFGVREITFHTGLKSHVCLGAGGRGGNKKLHF